MNVNAPYPQYRQRYSGSELSAAALTRGLGTKVRRTNICKIGFHMQDLTVLLLTATLYILWILGMIGVIT